MKKLLILTFISFTLFNNCNRTTTADLLITHATIVDVQNDTTLTDRLIAISGGKIEAVDEMSNLEKFDADEVFDAAGKFVMPGLWDMHIHFRGGDSLAEMNKDFLPLLLSHGITAVRDAGGDITPHVLEWKKEIEAGELAGPHIFTSGPKIDGTRPAWPGSISVQDKEDIEAALDSLEEINADYVKMYDGNLTAENFYEIIRQAESRGLKSTGHMPMSADLKKAVELGLDGTEHLYYVLKSGSPIADSLTEQNLGYRMINPLIDSHDTTRANEFYRFLKENEHYVTPTLHVGKTLAEVLVNDHSSDTMLAYIAPEIQQTYAGRVNSAKRGGERYTRDRAKMIGQFKSMILPMLKAGVPILAGSDAGPFNSYVYPGISLHEELRLMVDAGLTPAEALATSVANGPAFFELEDEYGSIEKGKAADLLILSGNPLEDISQTKAISAVILNGRLLNKADLDELLRKLKEKYK